MFEPFDTYRRRVEEPRGRPSTPPSARLRTLAWMRYLLDHLPDVCAWATGNGPRPAAWYGRREADLKFLKVGVGRLRPTALSGRKTALMARALDVVFGPVFAGRQAAGGKWFQDKLARGDAHPSAQKIAWLDDLVPGSAVAYETLPAPFDPWFYDALDFRSPWFGRLFLLRAGDPQFHDPGWDELLEENGEAQSRRLHAAILDHRDDRWSLDESERRCLSGEIETALVHTAYPGEAWSPSGFHDALDRLHAARAARARGEPVPHPVTERMRRTPEGEAFAALTNAVAAYRLATLAQLEDRTWAAWWLRGALDGMRGAIRKHQRLWFYPLPHGTAAMQSALRLALKS